MHDSCKTRQINTTADAGHRSYKMHKAGEVSCKESRILLRGCDESQCSAKDRLHDDFHVWDLVRG